MEGVFMSKIDAIREINTILHDLRAANGYGYETPSENECHVTLAKIADVLIDYGYSL